MRIREIVAAVLLIVLHGCGGGGGGGGSGTPVSVPIAKNNVLPIIVDAGPANTVNVPFVSVTICSPGSSNCQTIDHIIVDTGSSGLRVMASELSSSLVLPQVNAGNGNPLVECTKFADGYTWGPVRAADVTLAGHTLSSLSIQVIGDASFTSVPSSCSSSGPSRNTVQTFGAKGILGVGPFLQDCGTACAQSAYSGAYYSCSGSSCQSVAVSLSNQIQNPVGKLSSDNNGVLIELPAIGATGATTVSGSLILGIGTQANNSLGSASVYALDPALGTFTTAFNGQNLYGFVDSGSNGLFFSYATTSCVSGFYCPPSTLSLSATNTGTNSVSGVINFNVANADSLVSTGNRAFNNLAGSFFGLPLFDWGLPFHFGRRVFTAIEGRSTPGGTGPYVAY